MFQIFLNLFYSMILSAQSPDLSPFDCFLWDHLESIDCETAELEADLRREVFKMSLTVTGGHFFTVNYDIVVNVAKFIL